MPKVWLRNPETWNPLNREFSAPAADRRQNRCRHPGYWQSGRSCAYYIQSLRAHRGQIVGHYTPAR
jgi:hypothetical protein